jgi:hypothetical protein
MTDWTQITLDESWDWCIAMWSSISRRCLKDTATHVGFMKEQFLKEHDIEPDDLDQNCFFCQYDKMKQTELEATQFTLKTTRETSTEE